LLWDLAEGGKKEKKESSGRKKERKGKTEGSPIIGGPRFSPASRLGESPDEVEGKKRGEKKRKERGKRALQLGREILLSLNLSAPIRRRGSEAKPRKEEKEKPKRGEKKGDRDGALL